jgi:hypothetical protein
VLYQNDRDAAKANGVPDWAIRKAEQVVAAQEVSSEKR